MDLKYTQIILKRLSTDSTLVVDAPRKIDHWETYNGVPPDIWKWLQSEFGEYVGNFVFFGYN